MITKTETIHDRLPKQLHRFCDGNNARHLPDWLSDQLLLENTTTAKRLTEVLGGEMILKYDPTCWLGDDDESQGHVFRIELPHIDEWPSMFCVDDREELKQQLIDQLNEAAKFYRKLAKAVEKATGRKGGGK